METHYEHIVLNEDRVPSIVGTTMKVVELVVEQQAYGWGPEESHFQHPSDARTDPLGARVRSSRGARPRYPTASRTGHRVAPCGVSFAVVRRGWYR